MKIFAEADEWFDPGEKVSAMCLGLFGCKVILGAAPANYHKKSTTVHIFGHLVISGRELWWKRRQASAFANI